MGASITMMILVVMAQMAGDSGGGSNNEDVQSVFDFAKLSSDTLLPSCDDALGEIN